MTKYSITLKIEVVCKYLSHQNSLAGLGKEYALITRLSGAGQSLSTSCLKKKAQTILHSDQGF